MAYKFQKGTAILSGAISPQNDDAFDLGVAAAQWKDLYLDGIAYIDQLGTDADPSAAYISSGEIDGTTIGGEAKAAGTFTTATVDALTATANLDIGAFEMRASTFESDVAIGTAPFTVASTTVVANLNASTLGGATMAVPGAIGGSTPAAGSFTVLTSTSTLVMPDVTSGKLLVADGTSYQEVALSGDAVLASGGALTIGNLAVTEAKIADDAVSLAKMAALTRASIIIGDASGNPSALAKGAASTFLQSDGTDTAYVALSGDATLSAGAITIGNNAVTLAKMAGLASANFILGDGSGDPGAVLMSGDTTMTNAGVTSIGATKVTDAMINDDVAAALAGVGLGAGSGVMTLEFSELPTLAQGDVELAEDWIAVMENDGTASKKLTMADYATSIAGTGITAVGGVLNADAAGGTVTNLGDAAGTLVEGTNFSSVVFSAARIWTLPASPTVGDVIVVKAPSNASAYTLTIARAGSQTIDGATSVPISSDYGSVSFVNMAADVWGIK
jgi:hypothetical protein